MIPRGLSLLLAAAMVGCAAYGAAPSSPQEPPPGAPEVAPGLPLAPRIYVTNQDDATVTVLSAADGDVLATVDLRDLGFGATARPHHAVAEPDGSFWYVSLIGENRVLKLDPSNRVVGQAEFEVPGLLALDVASDRLLVGRSMSAVNPPQRIGVIDRDDMSVEEIAVFFPRPHALAVHPSAGLAYSASLATNRMAVVDAAEEDVEVLRFPAPESHHAGHQGAGHDTEGMVHTLVQWDVSPDGRVLVGTGEISHQLLVFDVTEPGEPRFVRGVGVESRPWHPVFSPDGRRLWLANKGADAVTVVDTETWTVAAVIRGDGLAEPHGLAISPDGRRVFVSSNNLRGTIPGGAGTVAVIDAASHEILRVVPVGRNPTGVGTRARR